MLKSIPKSVLLCFLCACWLLPGLFNHEPWKADEPYSFGMVYHILQTGDWVVPTVAGEPFMEKPPLYYVTAAFFARLFSPVLPLHDGARLASGFFLLLSFLFAGLAGKRLWGTGQGVTTVALLLGSAGLLLNTHQLITDTALFAGCSIAIFGLILSEERPIAGGYGWAWESASDSCPRGFLPRRSSVWRRSFYPPCIHRGGPGVTCFASGSPCWRPFPSW